MRRHRTLFALHWSQADRLTEGFSIVGIVAEGLRDTAKAIAKRPDRDAWFVRQGMRAMVMFIWLALYGRVGLPMSTAGWLYKTVKAPRRVFGQPISENNELFSDCEVGRGPLSVSNGTLNYSGLQRLMPVNLRLGC